jgi:hypothetical protein
MAAVLLCIGGMGFSNSINAKWVSGALLIFLNLAYNSTDRVSRRKSCSVSSCPLLFPAGKAVRQRETDEGPKCMVTVSSQETRFAGLLLRLYSSNMSSQCEDCIPCVKSGLAGSMIKSTESTA